MFSIPDARDLVARADKYICSASHITKFVYIFCAAGTVRKMMTNIGNILYVNLQQIILCRKQWAVRPDYGPVLFMVLCFGPLIPKTNFLIVINAEKRQQVIFLTML